MALQLVAVCGDRGASMKFCLFHMMSISAFCSSHVSFERSNHTWTKFIQILNTVQPMKMESIAGLTQVFWSFDIEQPLLLPADTGWDKWHCSWSLCVVTAEPPWNSVYSIWCPSPLPALHMFLLKDLVMLEPNANSFGNKQMKCELCEILNREWCYGNKFESLNAYFVRLYALFLRTMPIWDWGVSRAAACTICSSQFLLQDAWNLGLVRLRTWGLRQLRICRKLQEVEGM